MVVFFHAFRIALYLWNKKKHAVMLWLRVLQYRAFLYIILNFDIQFYLSLYIGKTETQNLMICSTVFTVRRCISKTLQGFVVNTLVDRRFWCINSVLALERWTVASIFHQEMTKVSKEALNDHDIILECLGLHYHVFYFCFRLSVRVGKLLNKLLQVCYRW